jgi:cell division protein FtsN
MQNMKQRGGTILGMIIGLVIGLGIALGVALMITKTPMPFTNKLARPEKTPEANAPAVDPNRPLYGNRQAAKESPKAAAEPANTAPANTAAPPAENKPQIVELSNLPKKQEAKPAESKPADAKAAEDDKWSYYLQAGAFREQGDAEGLRAKLALIGVEARLSERQSENGTLYRVRIGPFNQLDAMNRVRTKLSDAGVDAAVVRTSKQ